MLEVDCLLELPGCFHQESVTSKSTAPSFFLGVRLVPTVDSALVVNRSRVQNNLEKRAQWLEQET